MNTKELFGAARFAFVRLDDNHIVDFSRLEGAEDDCGVRVQTVDGVPYYIPDQDVEISFGRDGLNPIKLKAEMEGRLPEDREVEVVMTLQKLEPVSESDLLIFRAKSNAHPFKDERGIF